LPTSIIRDNHPVKRGRRIHPDRRPLSSELSRHIRERFQACKLELHPGKTRIVYCKDINRTEDHPDVQFTFLGYTFAHLRFRHSCLLASITGHRHIGLH